MGYSPRHHASADRRGSIAILLAFLAITARVNAGEVSRSVQVADSVSVVFLDRDSAREAIVSEKQDPFFTELSVIDLEARLGRPVDEAYREQAIKELKALFRDSVAEWEESEISQVAEACRTIARRSSAVCPGFIPQTWKFIKTDGREEGGAAYTRADAIILSAQRLRASSAPSAIVRLVAHETCHVYGRLHPETRAKLLKRLGFEVVDRVDLGEWIEAQTLTNPDGPSIDSVIQLMSPEGQPVSMALLLYAQPARFSPERGRGVMNYLKFGLIEVTKSERGWVVRNPNGLEVVPVDRVMNFFEQVGRNTPYIIGPDEILAENIALFLSSDAPVALPDPLIPVELARIIGDSSEKSIADPMR